MQYSSLVKRIAGDGADAWQVHYTARQAQDRGESVILLSVGDPDLDTPPAVVEQAIARMRAGDTHYTPAAGRDHLREAIAATHRARTGQPVDADNVIFLAGAQNALFAASLCLIEAGDEVIALEPLYPTYPATLEAAGARMLRVRSPAANGFRVDLRALEAAITPKTRAIFFATPNNPSGVILSEREIEAIGALARRHSLWMVADEVYAGLAPGGKVPSLAARLPEQVVTIGSLSKSHAMPGWRAGWLVGPRSLVAHVEALAQCMLYGLPGFIQEAAATALRISAEAEARIRDYCATRRDILLAGLAATPRLRCFAPDAGMFMLLDVRETGLNGRDFVRELYARERVSVLDGGAFGEETGGCVRVCFAADESELREAIVRIRRFVSTLAK
ncbi:MAG TPA: pyridoxal phosphate-dependent aminotransferase [Steroidobacteraceae bacterium]|jgi:arginine:pyruvate transaminase|nr:pyridoxal phosphate-dependent aminotransferase [Steroidobacteraceae bacterium]